MSQKIGMFQQDPMIGGVNTNTMQTYTDQDRTLNQVNRGKAHIEIHEQPRSRGLRFRYKCEGRSAGTIPGESSTNEHRTYPTIKINNYAGPSAIVVVSCVTKDDPPRPHPHSLVGKDCKQGVCTVKLKGTTTVSFPSLGIQCATKREVQDALKQREKIRVDPWGTGYFKNTNNVELSTVRLAFQAFLPDANGKYTVIVPPTVSHCIFDKKAVTDLIICRLSRQSGSVKGGDEVFLLCEKVTKDDIQIRFFEETKDDGVVWEKYGLFGQQDVHRQVAIVFKTPEYRDQNITHPVTVMVQLRRPSDEEFSEPKPFQYIPNDPDPDFVVRKRKRKSMNFDNFLKDYKGPYQMPVEPGQNNSNMVKEKLKQKVKGGQAMKRQYTEAQQPQQATDNSHFPMPHYSIDNTGVAVTDHQPMEQPGNSYVMMSPGQPQQQWMTLPAADEQQAAMVSATAVSSVNVITENNPQMVGAVGHMTELTSITQEKENEIFNMLRKANVDGGVNSIPSLPSAIFDANRMLANASVQENLDFIQEQTVAREETVESMNEDLPPITQSHYTNINQM